MTICGYCSQSKYFVLDSLHVLAVELIEAYPNIVIIIPKTLLHVLVGACIRQTLSAGSFSPPYHLQQ